MNPEDLRDKLLDLLYDELPDDQAQAVRDAIQRDPELAAEYDKLRAARRALQASRADEPAGPVGVTFDEQPVAAAAGPSSESVLPRRRIRLRTLLSVAATLIVAGTIGLIVHSMSNSTGGPGGGISAGNGNGQDTGSPTQLTRAGSGDGPNASSPDHSPPNHAAENFAGNTGLLTHVAYAEPPTTTAVRTGVSLTILSKPANWPEGPIRRHRWEQAARQMSLSQVSNGWDDSGIQASNGWGHSGMQASNRWVQYRWPGMALVRDGRVLRSLAKGRNRVWVTGVPSGIRPDTVRIRSREDNVDLSVLEQNYQYDLASAWAILNRYVDRPVTAVFRDGQTVAGALLSYDAQSLVLQPEGEGPRTITQAELRAIGFDALPDGLRTQPTLQWHLDSSAGADRAALEVAYMTEGIQWRADYLLKIMPGKQARQGFKMMGDVRVPVITDTADLVGYATIDNQSGVTYENAQLKLLAGDANLIPPEVHTWAYGIDSNANAAPMSDRARGFQEKSFFEYHLYTLGRPTTIADRETKQLELVTGSDIELTRGYVFDPQRQPNVQVVHEFKNAEDNGLGKPLPKGVVRLYAPDPTGLQTFVQKTEIDHTPKNETIRVPWGFAFDLMAHHKVKTQRHRGNNDHHVVREYQLRNHKDYAVAITVVVRVPRSTYKFQSPWPWHQREVGFIEITVPVDAHDEVRFDVEYRYNPDSSSGLDAPGDDKAGTPPPSAPVDDAPPINPKDAARLRKLQEMLNSGQLDAKEADKIRKMILEIQAKNRR